MRLIWLQFGVRALLVLTAVVAAVTNFHVRWMRQRRAFLARYDVTAIVLGGERCRAPALLLMLGEHGINQVIVDDYRLKPRARELFPEARVGSLTDGPDAPATL